MVTGSSMNFDPRSPMMGATCEMASSDVRLVMYRQYNEAHLVSAGALM
jgi:hypothetical protein